MKIDTYTKVVLTGILILLGAIAFDYKPTMIMGGNEMIAGGQYGFHLKDGKVRVCGSLGCGPWRD